MKIILRVLISSFVLLSNLFAWVAIIFLIDKAFEPISIGAKFLCFVISLLTFQTVFYTEEIMDWLEKKHEN